MKQILIIAFLALIAVSAKAQGPDLFYNGTVCTLQVRVVCVDPNDCNIRTPLGTGAWTDVPPGVGTPAPLPTVPQCTVHVYEVRFDPNTNCSGSVFLNTDPTFTLCDPPNSDIWPIGARAPLGCPACHPTGTQNVQIWYDAVSNILNTQ